VLRATTDEIMYEVMRLSGQEYVDEYAQRAKIGLLARRNHGHGRGDGDASSPGEVGAGAASADEPADET
jgi:1-acyl-sn-glycerol-3-phosphate acyltransferase